MISAAAFAVLLAPLALALLALIALGHPGAHPRQVARLGSVATWFGVVVALAAGVATALDGLIESPTIGLADLGVSIRLDALSTIMLGMVALLAVVIFRFSVTYLDGDDRQGVFLGWLAATVAAVEVLVLAGDLFLLVAAWVATSLALHRLLVFYPERRRAVVAAHKKFLVARLGDVFLVAGAVLLYVRFDSGNLETIFQGASQLQPGWAFTSVGAAALCIGFAALLKSAQFPTHGWLVEVMETPTPVSALLHAGVLNAGPFIAIRMAFVLDDALPATALLIAVGGLTAVFASVALLPQPSVKVALAYSSAAHMGFMLMVCGMGVYPAALLHLVAHSFYKAHAFLSSGSVVDEARAAKVALPQRLANPFRVAGSALIALAIYLPLAVLFGIDFGGDWELLAIGAILVLGTTQLVAPALDSTGGVAGTVRAVVLALAVTVAFFALETGAHELLSGTLPEDVGRGALHLGLIALVFVAFTAVVLLQIFEPGRAKTAPRRALAVHFRNGFYANALFDRLIGALRTPRTEPEAAR